MPLTDAQVQAVNSANELHVSTYRPDGTTRKATPVWAVTVDGEVYVRSAFGPEGGWYRHAVADNRLHISVGDVSIDVALEPHSEPAVNESVDAAYRAKYTGEGNALDTMVSPPATETTTKLIPHGRDRTRPDARERL